MEDPVVQNLIVWANKIHNHISDQKRAVKFELWGVFFLFKIRISFKTEHFLYYH